MGCTGIVGQTATSEGNLKIYPVGLAGEVNYQEGILRSHPGEAVRVYHERDNPYDQRALRVENNVGDVIGYIPRSSWLQRAVHDDGLGIAATIKAISDGDGHGVFGVVLDVTLTDDPIFIREFSPRPRKGPKSGTKECIIEPSENERALALATGLIAVATVPLNCDCGSSYNHNYKGLQDDSVLKCPSCGTVADVSEAVLSRLDAELHALLLQMLAQERLPPVDVDAVRALRLGA